ncbi:MAG: phosphatase PAP2 family protein [Chloroflexota bacterium]
MPLSPSPVSSLPDTPDLPARPDPTRRFALAGAGFLAVVVAIYLAFVTTEAGQRIENAALHASSLRADSVRADSLAYLNQVSIVTFVAAMTAVALVGLLRRRAGLGVLAVGVMGSAALVAQASKVVLPRPELLEGPAWLLRNSFPSGTATVAASIGIAALMVVPDRLRWLTLVAAAALAAVIGQATQVTGWHRASDVLGGVALAAAFGCAGLLALARIGYVQPSAIGRVHPRVFSALMIVVAGSIALGIFLVAALLVFPLLRTPGDADSVFLHTASNLVTFGLSTVVIAAFAWVIQPYTLGTSGAPTVGDADDSAAIPFRELDDATVDPE